MRDIYIQIIFLFGVNPCSTCVSNAKFYAIIGLSNAIFFIKQTRAKCSDANNQSKYSPPWQAYFYNPNYLDPYQLYRPNPINIGGSLIPYLYFPLSCFTMKATIPLPSSDYITPSSLPFAGVLERDPGSESATG